MKESIFLQLSQIPNSAWSEFKFEMSSSGLFLDVNLKNTLRFYTPEISWIDIKPEWFTISPKSGMVTFFTKWNIFKVTL